MSLKILLIDQDVAFIVSIKTALEGTGEFRVSLAANGGAAEDLLRDGGYDAVVADFELPDMDVMELIRRLRRVDQTIPIVMCPHTNVHYERLHFMDVQGAIAKPYAARDLILYVRDTVRRTKNPATQPPPKPAAEDILREFEEMESTQRGDPPPSVPAEFGRTRLLLDGPPEDLPDTTLLPEEQNAADTRQLPDTDNLETLMQEHGWSVRQRRQTERLPARDDEPPRKPDDTPSVPDQDLDAIRQFLATDQGTESAEFGEVLDAISQTPVSEYNLPPDDQVFHSLVDSMRAPEQDRVRRTRLEELLAAISSDSTSGEQAASADNTLDYVLDAIRRGVPPSPVNETDLDDTTIGEVMDGLFEPAFEDVLAALAGKEISVEGSDEPTYGLPVSAESREPAPEDRFTPDEMSADQDRPAWLEAYEAEGIEPPAAVPPPPKIVEPPISGEDSSRYPATAALNAVTAPEKEGDLSLNALLAQIEQQLPPVLPHRPHLKPLPSWKKQGSLEASQDVRSLFDHLEGVRPESPAADEMAEALSDRGPETFVPAEPPVIAEDTRPSSAVRPASSEVEPESFSPELAAELDRLEADQAWFAPPQFESAPEPEEEAEPRPTFSEEAEIEPVLPGILTIDELYALAELPVEFTPVREMAPLVIEEPGEQAGLESVEPDAGHLITMPPDTAARLFEGEVSEEQAVAEEAEAAQRAVMLTQYALESSAQATLLSRPGRRLAQAGILPAGAMERLFYIVDAAWQTGPATSDALIRFITLPDMGEFLLYSTLVDHSLRLSMVFNASTPVRTIRRQARRLSESLDLIPEGQAPTVVAPIEPPAAQTRPSRPTDLRPPAGLHEEIAVEKVPEKPEEPQAAYTCLWLPYDPGQELEGAFADDLASWIFEVAGASRWAVDDLVIHSDYLQLSISIPQKTLPDGVIMQLMQETAQRSAEAYPAQVYGAPLWTDGYYLVAPPRELTEREIARFITYQRQAQLG
jgi:DNA-binding response OmpR family regulator